MSDSLALWMTYFSGDKPYRYSEFLMAKYLGACYEYWTQYKIGG